MHRQSLPPPHGRPDPTKLSGVHRKVRRVKRPGWNDAQHDLNEYRPSAQELLEKKLRLMSKEQLMRLAGITPPAPPPPSQQHPPANQQIADETSVGDSDADKENVRPHTTVAAALYQFKPSKQTTPTTTSSSKTAHSAALASDTFSTPASRVRVQPVVTVAPAAAAAAAASEQSSSTQHLQAPTLGPFLGYRTELRAGALLSPVLERSIETELDAETHMSSYRQSLLDTEQQPRMDDEETQLLISRIDSLTVASPARPPLLVNATPNKSTPTLHDVTATMQQLANTPPQLPTYAPIPPLPPTTPQPHQPAAASLAPPSTPSIHHRLFLLLKQVASHLESLSRRQSTDAAERAVLMRQLEGKERQMGQLQAKVQGLEGGLMLVQKQLLAMQRAYDEQPSGMVDALTLEQRQASSASVQAVDATQSAEHVHDDDRKRTFAVPPPFVSSQVRATLLPPQTHGSPASHRHHPSASTAALLTPPRSTLGSSPVRSATFTSFLSSPSPPRAGRSPRRTVARWDDVSKLEQRLQAAAAAAAAHHTHTNQPTYHTTRGSSSQDHTERAEPEAEGVPEREDAVVMTDLSSSTSSTFSSLLVPSLPESAKRSGRHSAGWPQLTAGWTVHN